MSGLAHRRGGAGAPLRGLFLDGVWHCDCSPRQPANHFEVKKPGKNQGKWFRTCQKQQNDRSRCNFFLWDGDAHPREALALASNSRTEPAQADFKTPSKRTVSPAPYRDRVDNGHSRKRDRITGIDTNDDYSLGTDAQAFETELDHIMTAVETPRKAAKTSELATPLTRRTLPWNKESRAAASSLGPQTPQTTHNMNMDTLFTPSRHFNEAHQTVTPSSSPLETPTPSRFIDVGSDDLVHEVFAFFQAEKVNLGGAIESSLKVLLSKHKKTAEGFRRGRDVTRSTIKAKDAKITELSYRISTLEAELEAEKAVVRHLQWEIETEDYTKR
ncbi:hypothetical protein E8E13_001236 [Curvularia kusanoi]|uniref:GRF-type domain-containing protein n=1 Tax=Curvularia kusanoi TaxID=90978 RepID=A0A9P4TCI7_CURKU|nr:hypothetical protein E8E13_001236 [Curvularia kusanoi]